MAECKGLALVTFTRIEKLARLSRGASKGCDTIAIYTTKYIYHVGRGSSNNKTPIN